LASRSTLTCAYFSPLPPQRSGIADYSAELLPHLARHMAIDVYVDAPDRIDRSLVGSLKIGPIAGFLASPDLYLHYDVCVYHMGNQPVYHERIYRALQRFPGIVVLHEFDLHSFFWNRSSDRAAYLREMGYAYGLEGLQAARRPPSQDVLTGKYPLFNRLADVSVGVIVHTDYARRSVLAASPRARVKCIPHAVSTPDVLEAPDQLKPFPAGDIVLASLGYLAPSKRIESVLRALAQLRREAIDFRYVLVGEQVPGCDFTSLIQEIGLSDVVELTGFVNEDAFRMYLKTIDIGINLRTEPTGGEMSGSLVRLMAGGRPVIVSDVGGFADLPDDCVIKIRQDETEIEQLAAALRRLIADPMARARYGDAARRYVAQELSFPGVAQKYAAFIHECLE
jgi:glycosyltransferase involved in cell wall biosynthesis